MEKISVVRQAHCFLIRLTLPDYTTSMDSASHSLGVVLLARTIAWEGTEYNHPMQWVGGKSVDSLTTDLILDLSQNTILYVLHLKFGHKLLDWLHWIYNTSDNEPQQNFIAVNCSIYSAVNATLQILTINCSCNIYIQWCIFLAAQLVNRPGPDLVQWNWR